MKRFKRTESLDVMAKKGYIQYLALPIFFEQFLQLLVGNIDQLMVSAYSAEAVAAVGNSNQISSLVIITFSFLCTAATVLISQYRGYGDAKKEHQMYALSFSLNLAIGIVVSSALLFLNVPIFRAMNLPEESMASAHSYMSIVGGTMFVQMLFLTFAAFLRSNTMMKESMMISIAVNLLNTVGNLLFINGYLGMPALGATGAALATMISRILGLAAIIIVYCKKVGISFLPHHLRPFPGAQLKKLLSLALPGACEPLSYNLAQVVILSFINVFGLAAVNTQIYCNLFVQLSYIYTRALSQASQVVVGRLIGAGRKEDAERTMSHVIKTAVLTSFCITVAVFFLARPLFSLFTENPEILALGTTILGIDIIRGFPRSFNLIFVNALHTAGDVVVPVAIAIASGWIISVAGGYLVGVVLNLGLIGIWIAVTLDETVRATIMYTRWRSGRWKKRNLVGD